MLCINYTFTSSFANFARSATSPSFTYVSNLVPDSSVQSCCSPIASTSVAAPRLHQSTSTAAPRLHPLQLLLPNCIDLLQLLLPTCVRFSCCSPIVSASAAAPRLRPRAAAPRLHLLRLLLPDCAHFDFCSLIASLRLLLPDCIPL